MDRNCTNYIEGGPPPFPASYDDKGNLTAYGDVSFEYDAFNRLISASGTGPDGQTFSASYAYDALGRRVQKVVNGTETDFVYDGQQVIEERDDEADLLRQYAWGQYVDELVQQREYEQPPFGGPYGDLYPLGDLLYRSWALTHDRECGSGSSGGPGGGGGGQGSSSGSCSPNTPFVEVYDMDAYGRTRIYNGRGPDCQWFTDDDVQTYTPLCRYIFAGREYDPETGMTTTGRDTITPIWGGSSRGIRCCLADATRIFTRMRMGIP